MVSYLQVRKHAQQAPQETAVYCLSVSFPFNEQQNAVDGFTLDLQITDDVEPEQLQTHVPAHRSSLLNAHFNRNQPHAIVQKLTSVITHQIDGSIEFCKT